MCRFARLGGFTLWLMSASAAWSQQGLVPLAAPSDEDLAAGRRQFDSQCSRCHGRDGSGGAGPSLQRARLRKAATDEALLNAIQQGLPGTNMPGNWQLTPLQVAQVAAHVRSLGRVNPEPLPGDPARGRALFEGGGGCIRCHMVGGQGGSLGPDLTEIGLLRGAPHLRESLLDPGKALPARVVPYEPGSYAAYLPVRAAPRNGAPVSGLRLNEDTFTIQIRDEAGALRSFRKAALERLEKYPDRSSMPSYEGVFSPEELDDLVAFLASLRGEP